MPLYYQAGASVATTDTTEVSFGTITLTAKAKMVIGVWCHVQGGAGNTTLENVTGTFRLQSTDLDLSPIVLPLKVFAITGTGAVIAEVKVWPIELPVGGTEGIECLVTLDLAQTINPSGRFGLVSSS